LQYIVLQGGRYAKSCCHQFKNRAEYKSTLGKTCELAKVTNRSKSFIVGNALESYFDVNERQIKGIIIIQNG
jgi:hypothetical protein